MGLLEMVVVGAKRDGGDVDGDSERQLRMVMCCDENDVGDIV